jgi:CubicO group peptidase (beta-lactamase class C family)
MTPSARILAAVFFLLALPAPAQERSRPAEPYFPGTAWEHRTPAQAGFDPARLQAAIDFAVAAESRNPRDMAQDQRASFGKREPMAEIVGPMRPRGDMTGLVVHRGYIVAQWGDPARVDMTHSVTKSFLSSVVGVAFDRGLVASLDDPVHRYVPPVQPFPAGELLDLFPDARARAITWDHLLRQTSDWEGTLWGKPDWVDRPGPDPQKNRTRARAAPGATWKYNDTRVNLLALAALNVWRRPLPQVLKETIMDPIGASDTWRWFGYAHSFVVIDGMAMQSVSGGGHYGGGMFINAYDMARFGLLTSRGGRWRDRQLLSKRWIDWALTPTPANRGYGFMNYFLNVDRQLFPNAAPDVYAHVGNGTNLVIVDPGHDLVVVLRWIDSNKSADEFLRRLVAALNP